MDNEGVADAAAVCLTLPTAEGRIASPGPAPGVVVEGGWTAQLIDLLQVFFQRLGDVVEEQILID